MEHDTTPPAAGYTLVAALAESTFPVVVFSTIASLCALAAGAYFQTVSRRKVITEV